MESSAAYLLLLLVLVLSSLHLNAEDSRKVYLVYVNGGPDAKHMEVLEQALDKGRTASESHIYSYKESFTGFAARLTDEERKRLEGVDDVLAVQPSREFELKTTRSWDFLRFPTNVNRPEGNVESNLIVGVIDTGIWPDSESFRDNGLGPPPTKWKGACQNITCNNKIIGARAYYTGNRPLIEEKSVVDVDGHGTHTASTAAGMEVKNASFFGLAEGVARGGVPSARIAVYKVCWKTISNNTCLEHDIMAALDDAILDGVDMISASIGGTTTRRYNFDAFAIGSFRAMKRGIFTSAAGGNDGPDSFTVTNGAPWILTVAASSIDRKFVAEIELGDNQSITGKTINPFPTQESFYPLAYGQTSRSNTTEGKNVIIAYTIEDVEQASKSGARGIIAVSNQFAYQAGVLPLPGVCLTRSNAAKVKTYTDKTKNPVGKIYKSKGIVDTTAPAVAIFSSRGPNLASPDILKPDISAPGVEILAAWSPKASPTGLFPSDKRSSPFNIISGTSMACPHATGIALYVKAFHPSWSPAAIKSALMTTATPMSHEANPQGEFAFGVGHINPLQALNPGLVYDANEEDYVKFLCAEGYSIDFIRHITGDNNITCSSNFTSPRDLNYPSMSARVTPKQPFKVEFKRTVTNVGSSPSLYKAETRMLGGINITVTPPVLSFRSLGEKLEFLVVVAGGPFELGEGASVSLVWSDGKNSVRSPILIYALGG